MTNKTEIENRIQQVIYVVMIITALSLVTYVFLKLISPYSKALGSFLFGFALVTVSVTLLALYIKYIVDLYKEIRNFR
jgi:uncharacterized RDD family membrane protein YckC